MQNDNLQYLIIICQIVTVFLLVFLIVLNGFNKTYEEPCRFYIFKFFDPAKNVLSKYFENYTIAKNLLKISMSFIIY